MPLVVRACEAGGDETFGGVIGCCNPWAKKTLQSRPVVTANERMVVSGLDDYSQSRGHQTTYFALCDSVKIVTEA